MGHWHNHPYLTSLKPDIWKRWAGAPHPFERVLTGRNPALLAAAANRCGSCIAQNPWPQSLTPAHKQRVRGQPWAALASAGKPRNSSLLRWSRRWWAS